MWRLVRARLKHRWQRPFGFALQAGLYAAAVEWFYEGRSPEEWWTAVPVALLVAALTCSWWIDFEAREHRPALLKQLPESTTAIALSNALVPPLIFLTVVLTTVMIGTAIGSLDSADEFRAIGVWMLVLLDLLLLVQLWAELKPRLIKTTSGRLVHYLLPFICGGLGGGFLAANRWAENETLAQAALRWMSPTLGVVAFVAALLMSITTVVLFARRDDYVS